MLYNLSSDRRIAKNTLLLYLRLLIVVTVNLYTSRIVLTDLGASDYGIYSVVGGLIIMFSFLSGSMSGATSRYLTFELGRDNRTGLNKTFSASLNLYLIAGLIIVLFGEIVGIWFLNNKLVIPEARMDAAFWVLQCSVTIAFFSFSQTPYSASIVAHENMSVFAYVGIYEAISKLAIAYAVMFSSSDKLKVYALLLAVNQIAILFFYRLYCRHNYHECRFRIIRNPNLYKKLLSYSGYDMMPSMASVVQNQGIDILLNMFFGPVVNAAKTIAIQVDGICRQFMGNVLQAFRPQIIKQYANGSPDEMYRLTFNASRFSYVMFLAIYLPMVLETDYLLAFWLGDALPHRTSVFCRLVLMSSVINPLVASLTATMHAIGRLKWFSITNSCLYLLPLPLGYLFLTMGYPDYSVLLVAAVANMLIFVNMILLLHHQEPFSLHYYIKDVLLRCLMVTVVVVFVAVGVRSMMDNGLLRVIAITLASETLLGVLTWNIVFHSEERMAIKLLVCKRRWNI